ncbi:uncharacterized protein N7511_011396 [Penicillium nucicola]|uniref:uncharacterized protein n=1 Tax=Penicillium nucicola TaxID=1850975 RepID=UPI002545503F|nr:uncharacterized protein N7511_011396 [Penicillium nucicola]KAJ5742377.1 hypothetical protein N7511_011396 [Penicillium nucicola]
MNPQPPDPRAGRKPFPPLRRPSSISKSATPPTPPELPAPQRTTQEKFFISTTYSTITARALSFRGQVLSGVTPLQLAKNGFHYQPFPSGGLACCFACQSAKRLDSFQRLPFQEIQQLHRADCIWKVISSDLKQHLDSTDTHSSSTNTHPPPRSGSSPFSSKREQPKKTTTDASTQTQAEPAQKLPPTAEEYFNDSRAPPPSNTTDPESRLPPPTVSPQPPHPTPSITTLPLSQQPTYASVLQYPTTTSPRSIPKTREPVPPTRPILTIEDLHRRFYNKPSPFQLESKTKKRLASQVRNNSVSATNSLSKFLTSALPAFSRFLAEMQPNSNNATRSRQAPTRLQDRLRSGTRYMYVH